MAWTSAFLTKGSSDSDAGSLTPVYLGTADNSQHFTRGVVLGALHKLIHLVDTTTVSVRCCYQPYSHFSGEKTEVQSR